MARQTDFTQELGDEICERIAEGESLRAICRSDDTPNIKSFLRWVGKYPELKTQYDAATEARMQHLFDEMREIADDSSKDWVDKPDGKGGTIRAFDHEHVQRAKLRVDTLKWALSKMDPKRFGDKIETTGTTAQNLTVTWEDNSEMARERRDNPNLFLAKTIMSWVAKINMKLVPKDAVVLNPPAHIPEDERAGYGDHLVKIGLLAPVEKRLDLEALPPPKDY